METHYNKEGNGITRTGGYLPGRNALRESQQYAMLDDLLKDDERITTDEIDNIESQIAERERIKRRNLRFLEWQRQKLEELINRTECLNYRVMGTNDVKNRLTTQMILVEMRKGDEYVNAFRDVQRLEEQKRKLTTEISEGKGWLK